MTRLTHVRYAHRGVMGASREVELAYLAVITDATAAGYEAELGAACPSLRLLKAALLRQVSANERLQEEVQVLIEMWEDGK